VFDEDTDIVSTLETHRLIVDTLGHDDFDTFMENAEGNLESTLADYGAAEEPAELRQLAFWVDYHRSLVDAEPILRVRPPNLTLSGHLAFHGPDRPAELIPSANGHILR
jgi:hypothetical protein